MTPESPKNPAPRYRDKKAAAGEISTLSAFILGESRELSSTCVRIISPEAQSAEAGDLKYAAAMTGTAPMNGPAVGIRQKMPYRIDSMSAKRMFSIRKVA